MCRAVRRVGVDAGATGLRPERHGRAIVCVLVGLVASGPAVASAQTVLGLAEVWALAREQAPQIVRTRLAVAEARGRLTGASLRWSMNPEFDLNAGHRQGGTTRSTDLQLGATQMFEPSARRAARIAGATAHVDQSAATVETTTREVLVDTSRLFYHAVYAAERVRLLTTSVDLARSIYEVADRRFRAGDLAALDVNVARAALARVRFERDTTEAEQAVTLGALRVLLGLDGPIVLRGDLALSAPPNVAALAQAVEQRPEVRVLQAAIREADADLAIAKTFTTPNYGVGLRYQREGGDHIVLGAFTVSLPLFSKGQELGTTGTARGARLRAELDATRARVRIELESALAAYERRVAAARVLETEALPGLDDSDALTMRSFDAGQIGLPDVLLIRRELIDTRFQYLLAMFEAALARVTVDAAAGVLR